MIRKCGKCKYCNDISEIEVKEYQKDGYTGLRCMLSGKWVCLNDLCSLSFDIVRRGRWHYDEEASIASGVVGIGTGIGMYACSLCGYNTFMPKDVPMDFCPRCGANMGQKDLGMKRINIDSYNEKELWEEITGIELKKEWQSVFDRLPPYNETVLVISEDGSIEKCLLNENDNQWYRIDEGQEKVLCEKKPAYWMETDFPNVERDMSNNNS